MHLQRRAHNHVPELRMPYEPVKNLDTAREPIV